MTSPDGHIMMVRTTSAVTNRSAVLQAVTGS